MTGPTRAYVIPWMTALLLAGLSWIFWLELHYPLDPAGANAAPAAATLLAFGGLSPKLVEGGDIYRMLSAPFLHGSLRHLEANLLALAIMGYSLERGAGRAWLCCIFTAGGLAGSVTALLVGGDDVLAGASGSVMAMVTANFVISFRFADNDVKYRSWILSVVALGLALFPLTQAGASHLSYGVHIGGAILGAMLGGLLLASWWEDEELPAFQIAAFGLSFAAIISTAIIAYGVASRYP